MGYSSFGERVTSGSGILQLMDDLGRASASEDGVIMLGGGNPSQIPRIHTVFRERMEQVLAEKGRFEKLVGRYGPPQGDRAFAEALANLLHDLYDWPVTERNIALTSGSQTAFFFLFNLFAGRRNDRSMGKILLPMAPEYIGYADVGLEGDLFVSGRPYIELVDEHLFKYRVNFQSLDIDDDIGAICISRPTNPTGNVLTDNEVANLDALARRNQIPLIIDNAYGAPFPNIIFEEVAPIWHENIILCLSLSKLGLPGARTGIVVADEATVAAVSEMNAVVSLAPGGFGALLAQELVESGEIVRLSRRIIRPHYRRRMRQARDWLIDSLAETHFRIHVPEGAFFLWLWFKDLPISVHELYERLKERGVIVVPGHHFFPGLAEPWPHMHECLRMNYAQEKSVLQEGIGIIAEEVKRAYANGS